MLLEAGAGPATRRAAARQLGEVQKAHPEELHRLLGRLTKHLRSPAWETRVAAAQVIETRSYREPFFMGLRLTSTCNDEAVILGTLAEDTYFHRFL